MSATFMAASTARRTPMQNPACAATSSGMNSFLSQIAVSLLFDTNCGIPACSRNFFKNIFPLHKQAPQIPCGGLFL
ncbi:MAG: hypothetical protein IJA83_10815 [Clostridia bacterium]|nr:hypothetical protein [Clostridia bacterium]